MVPMDEYPANHYPSFCSGSGFIISKNATGKIFEVAKIGSILGTLFGVQILDPLLGPLEILRPRMKYKWNKNKTTDNFRFPDVHLTGILRMKSKLKNPVESSSGRFSNAKK